MCLLRAAISVRRLRPLHDDARAPNKLPQHSLIVFIAQGNLSYFNVS